MLAFFPNVEGQGGKRRPALVVSSDAYNWSGTDVTLAQITSNVTRAARPGDHRIREWQACGLTRPSMLRARLVTLHESLVERPLGTLSPADLAAFERELAAALGMEG